MLPAPDSNSCISFSSLLYLFFPLLRPCRKSMNFPRDEQVLNHKMAILETSLNRLLVRNLNYFSPENSPSVIKQNKSEGMLEDTLED